MCCVQNLDIKSIVAYSSVAHMGAAIAGLITKRTIGLGGALVAMISHGATSSILFYIVNLLYLRTITRRTVMISGFLHQIPVLAGF